MISRHTVGSLARRRALSDAAAGMPTPPPTYPPTEEPPTPRQEATAP